MPRILMSIRLTIARLVPNIGCGIMNASYSTKLTLDDSNLYKIQWFIMYMIIKTLNNR